MSLLRTLPDHVLLNIFAFLSPYELDLLEASELFEKDEEVQLAFDHIVHFRVLRVEPDFSTNRQEISRIARMLLRCGQSLITVKVADYSFSDLLTVIDEQDRNFITKFARKCPNIIKIPRTLGVSREGRR